MMSNFRVVVVGGGVAGLTASHALQRAGIDHVVLERSEDVAPPVGASTAIYPHGVRILHQIGCLAEAKAACTPGDQFVTRGPDGKVWSSSPFFANVKQNHGQDLLLLERRDLLRILHNCLPDKSPVRLGCKVRDIVEDADGVEVTLDDGTVERGDMVIGCDGVHSIVREKMWDLSNREVPGSITVQEKTSLVTRWKCLVGVGPPTPELGTRDMTVVHHDRYSFLFLTQPDKLFFFVFFRLDEEFRWPERRWYSTADADKLAASISDHPVCESLVFGEVWKKKLRGALISVEEGVFKHWSHGRVVLAGDSVHKMTPNIALGGNSAMESVAALCNHIQRTAVSHRGRWVSRATLRKAFEQYQLEREGRMKEVMELSAFISRVQAMDGMGMKLVAKFVLPYQAHHKSTDQMGALIKAAPKLDYLPVDKSFARGRLMWEDEEEKIEGRQQGLLAALLSRAMMYLAGGVAVLAVVYSVLF